MTELKLSDCQEKHDTRQNNLNKQKLEKVRNPEDKKLQNKKTSAQLDHFYRNKTMQQNCSYKKAFWRK